MPQPNEYFHSEDHGDVTVVQVPSDNQMLGLDLAKMYQLWDILEDVRERHRKVLLLRVPAGNMSPATVDDFRKNVVSEKPIQTFSTVDKYRPPSLGRVDNAITHLLQTIYALDTFVIVAFEGQVDFDLLGLLLCCDYRICSEDTTFVNRILDVGVAPGGGVLWFLSRYLGYAQTYDIVVEGKSLTAPEARELKLVNRVVSRQSLNSEALLAAERFATKPAPALHSLVRAADFLDHDFLTYLKHIGSGFGELPPDQQR